ncbi:hypothetical protein Tco_1386815 [Tanacetum coccineum]
MLAIYIAFLHVELLVHEILGKRNYTFVMFASVASFIHFSHKARDSVMSSASTVTYTSVYTDSEPGRVFWGADEELSDGVSLRVIVPYVPEPKYPEYIAPSDAEAPLEDQPLPADDSPTTLSPGYVADSDLDEDPEEDPEEDHADYPADRGDDDDDESSDDDDDDDDTDDEDEEPFEDEDDDEEMEVSTMDEARLLDQEAHIFQEAWAHSVGLSLAVHYELQAYKTHTQMHDYRIASQESLGLTLICTDAPEGVMYRAPPVQLAMLDLQMVPAVPTVLSPVLVKWSHVPVVTALMSKSTQVAPVGFGQMFVMLQSLHASYGLLVTSLKS